MPGELAYVATKGAVEAFTRTLAAEVGHKGITVNAINPGPTDTGWMTEELKREIAPMFSSGRIGQPEDAARLVAFLACDEGPGSRARSSIPRAVSCVLERHVRPPYATITAYMRVSRKFPRLFREPPRTLFDDPRYEAFEAPVKGPLFSTLCSTRSWPSSASSSC